MRSKLSSNINIELEKGKFIVFSGEGYDFVIKVKKVNIVTNKNYYHDEFDPEYLNCNSVSLHPMS